MATIALLQPRAKRPGWLDRTPEGITVRPVLETELTAHPPDSLAGVLVDMHIDQHLFASRRRWIEAHLSAGGTIVFCGLLADPFLPQLPRFEPLPRRNRAALTVSITVPDHPLFAGVAAEDLTARKGVAGFYGRGQVRPPPGAVVLTWLDGGRVPLDWVWHPPMGGRLLMHPGNNLWMYAEDDTTAARLTPHLLRWAAAPVTVNAAAVA